jgi:hypothetical protein
MNGFSAKTFLLETVKIDPVSCKAQYKISHGVQLQILTQAEFC